MEDGIGDEVVKILLNGIPLTKFIAFYIVGLVGAIISFGINVGQAVRRDKSTPSKFKFSHLKIKFIRWVTTILLLAVGIVFNKEILGGVFESETSIELTLWSSLLVGMSTDQIGKYLSGKKRG
jgi:hypothetical protein